MNKERLELLSKDLIKTVGEPKPPPNSMIVGVPDNRVRLQHLDLGFDITVNGSKSWSKNLRFAMTVFELYCEEFKFG